MKNLPCVYTEGLEVTTQRGELLVTALTSRQSGQWRKRSTAAEGADRRSQGVRLTCTSLRSVTAAERTVPATRRAVFPHMRDSRRVAFKASPLLSGRIRGHHAASDTEGTATRTRQHGTHKACCALPRCAAAELNDCTDFPGTHWPVPDVERAEVKCPPKGVEQAEPTAASLPLNII